MKKALILAYDFPPYVSVGGLRPYSWSKYLQEFGVFPVVITRQWDNKHGNHLDYIAPSESTKNITEVTEKGLVIKTPYFPNFANRLMLKYGDSKYIYLRKAVSAYYEFAQFLFPVGPKASLYFAAEEYLKTNKVDVIIATGDPFILFSYSAKLSNKFGIPWIADYRDPWSQKTNIQNNLPLKLWHSYFEKKIVSSAALIITVSEFLKLKISTTVANKKIEIVPNGFDPELVENAKNIQQQSDFLGIALVGSIYDWHPIRSFLFTVADFIKANDAKIKISFYGINIYNESIKSGLHEFFLEEFPSLLGHVEIHKKMPNDLLLKELAKQNVMLLFNDYSILGTKVFDYLGINRTILFCYTNDVDANVLREKYFTLKEVSETSDKLQEELIRETNSGYILEDAKHLYKTLELLNDEFQKNRYISCNTVKAENYSRKQQVKQLAEIVKTIASKN